MAELPALSISPENAYFIVAKARQFDAKDGVTARSLAPMPAITACVQCWRTERMIRFALN
jgi:hypothetical protein